jgi:hypothetical protein
MAEKKVLNFKPAWWLEQIGGAGPVAKSHAAHLSTEPFTIMDKMDC